MCLTSSRLLTSLWTPGIGIQNHLFGQLPWIRSWRNCNGAGKPSKTSSRDAHCRVHEKGGKNNSSRLGDTTLAKTQVSKTELLFITWLHTCNFAIQVLCLAKILSVLKS